MTPYVRPATQERNSACLALSFSDFAILGIRPLGTYITFKTGTNQANLAYEFWPAAYPSCATPNAALKDLEYQGINYGGNWERSVGPRWLGVKMGTLAPAEPISNAAGLLASEANRIAGCSGVTATAPDPGYSAQQWGPSGEVELEYNADSGVAYKLFVKPGYKGNLDISNVEDDGGTNEYVLAPGSAVTNNGAPVTLDWSSADARRRDAQRRDHRHLERLAHHLLRQHRRGLRGGRRLRDRARRRAGPLELHAHDRAAVGLPRRPPAHLRVREEERAFRPQSTRRTPAASSRDRRRTARARPRLDGAPVTEIDRRRFPSGASGALTERTSQETPMRSPLSPPLLALRGRHRCGVRRRAPSRGGARALTATPSSSAATTGARGRPFSGSPRWRPGSPARLPASPGTARPGPVDVGQAQLLRRYALGVPEPGEQQFHRVPVGGDGLRRGGALPGQVAGEELRQPAPGQVRGRRGPRAHGWSPGGGGTT